jgi:hypothetical protein
MLNWRYGTLFPPEPSQRPGFDLLAAPDKRRVLGDTDHIPATIVHVRRTLACLDDCPGPVARRAGLP